MTNEMSGIPVDYHCPLCDHQDDDFVWLELAEVYVCLGCRYEIDCGMDFERQPTVDEYNCADTIERLLALLGVDYEEATRRYRELIETGKMRDLYSHIVMIE